MDAIYAKYYKTLSSRVRADDSSLWYSRSESIFASPQAITKKNFVRLIAYAYSWMPTVPKWDVELDWSLCGPALRELKKRGINALEETTKAIIPWTNNSIVGASKVLHFFYPEVASIIDSNVVRAWRALFCPHGYLSNVAPFPFLPSDFNTFGRNERKRDKRVHYYADYAQSLLNWSKAVPEVRARDIERMLYLYGKRLSG